MERLVTRIGTGEAVPTEIYLDFVFGLDKRTFDGLKKIFNQLCTLTDIIGDDYDLARLHELVEADRDGRCVVLPCKPGSVVQFRGNPNAEKQTVDCISFYADGKITFGFHDYGVKTTFVDEWGEDDAENYTEVKEDEINDK